MGGRRQTAAGELGSKKDLNPAVVRPPQDACRRQAQRERAGAQEPAETHHQLQGNPKHDAQGMEPVPHAA